jgi:LPXTG-motif cell wall-anchored protein
MLNAPEGAVQPAHIHKGTCTNLDPNPSYPLNDIKEGKSTTVVKVSLEDLAKEKYAINVHKSATEISLYVSCGNLPQGTTSSGPLTMDQALTKLLDDATELLGNIKKKETDASKNAYEIYHGTFAANEGAIQAKNKEIWQKLEDEMHEVRDAVNESNWTEAETAANELIGTIKEAQTELGGSSTTSSSGSSSGSMSGVLTSLKTAAADVQREAQNNDKDGAQRAYDEFHTLFAANENDIRAKNAEAQAHIEEAMHEVRDAIQAGDLTKAATASTELVNEVNDAANELAADADTDEALPSTGNSMMIELLTLAGASLALVGAGIVVRRRTNLLR